MRYDAKEITNTALWRWEGDDYYVLSYPPKRRRTIATDFILDFKNNNEEAVTLAAELILKAVKKIEPILKQQYLGAYVVSVPPSGAGRLNIPCERVCMAIERDFDWLKHLQGALRRATSVRKSAYAPSYERPTYDDHRQSIEYVGAARASGKSILMLDDVRTQGNVSGACRDILIEKTGCKRVIGIYLGRTE